MKRLYDEVLRRFPEVADYQHDGDDESYVLMYNLSRWLFDVGKNGFSGEVVQRVVAFDRWCREQPGGETAADDIMTIVVVGLHEELFDNDVLLPLVKELMPREDLVRNREYLTTWVGEERYLAALRSTE